MSDDRNTAALRKLIRNPHIARLANETYFKTVNFNWDQANRPIAMAGHTKCPLAAALEVIEKAEDFASS